MAPKIQLLSIHIFFLMLRNTCKESENPVISGVQVQVYKILGTSGGTVFVLQYSGHDCFTNI